MNLAGTLTPLPSNLLDAASLMRERCAARRSGERAPCMGPALPHPRLAPALWIALTGLAAAPASAQSQGLVERDDSLGSGRLEVVGPGVDPEGRWADYPVTPELGEQHGENLFHSFWRFGIGQGETATFTGPDPIDGPQSVRNVISRVSGPEPSPIRSTARCARPSRMPTCGSSTRTVSSSARAPSSI